jgi:hypothetical protein
VQQHQQKQINSMQTLWRLREHHQQQQQILWPAKQQQQQRAGNWLP